MTLDRANSTAIRSQDREAIFSALGLTNRGLFAQGTEAEVYERDETSLLKIYAGTDRLSYFQTLRDLYTSINMRDSGLILPRILDIKPFGQALAIVETRLSGQPLEDVLSHLSGVALQQAEDLYIDAVYRLRRIQLKEPPVRYLLFDKHGISDTSRQSFAWFYAACLETKWSQVRPFFEETINSQAAALIREIRQQPETQPALIHGDFFPGNLLVDDTVTQVTGIIDFGSFTMFGNPLLDLAGAFGYYRMYDPDRRLIRAALLPRILKRLPLFEQKHFYQFVLANAILTSNLYSQDDDPRGDGHFQWAAEIVSTPEYWDQALAQS